MEYFNNNTELVTKVIPKDKEGLFKEFIGKMLPTSNDIKETKTEDQINS